VKSSSTGQMMLRLAHELSVSWGPLHIIAYLIGFTLVGIGLVQFVGQRTGRYQGGALGPLMTVFAGIALLNILGVMNLVMQSTLSTQSLNALNYSNVSGGSSIGKPFIEGALAIVEFVGFIGVIRGCIMIAERGKGNQNVGTGSIIAHLVGGTFAVNFTAFLHTLGVTFGGPIQSSITHFIH